MPLTFENYDGFAGLHLEQVYRSLSDTGWLNGLVPSLNSTDSANRIDYTSGDAFVDGVEHNISAGSIDLPDGDGQYPRVDVIYVDSAGSVQSEQGPPRQVKPDGAVARKAYQPEPPDLDGITGAVIAAVWVPQSASGASDFDDPTVDYVMDRRLRPWPEGVYSSTNQISHDTDLTDISADDHHTRYDAEEAQDDVGGILQSPLTYDDAAPAIDIADGGITPALTDLTQAWNFTGGLQSGGDDVVTTSAADIQSAPNFAVTVQLGADGSGNDQYSAPVTLQDGDTLNVYLVSIALADGTAPPSGIEFEITQDGGVGIGSPATVSGRDNRGDPVMSYTNSSGSVDTVFLTLDNDTANAYDPDSGNAAGVALELAYRVE
jgi:hypothetical protein